MKLFIDTGPWLARQIKQDQYNLSAKKQYNQYKKQRAIFYTNDYVLSEVYTRLIYDVHLPAARRFYSFVIDSIQKNQLSVFEIDNDDRERAWIELERYSDHKLSFTDATIIANFKEYNLDEIFTFDRTFQDINLPTNQF